MTKAAAIDRPIRLQAMLALVRLMVLGGGIICFMGRAETGLSYFHERPFLSITVRIGLALAAIAIYMAYGKLVEHRDVTELSTPGIAGVNGVWAFSSVWGFTRPARHL